MRIGSVETPVTIVAYAIFGAVFAGIGLFILRENPIAGLVFGGIGALSLFGALHSYLGARRYGNVALELVEPAVPGGRLIARLDCPGGTAGASLIHAEVNCKKVEWIVQGRERHLIENVIWTAKRSFPVRTSGKGAKCDIDFDLPADAPLTEGGSTETRSMPGIYWEVQVETPDVPGVDLMRGFRFPVVAGTPTPSVVMRPKPQPVTPTPQQAARAAQAKRQSLRAGKAASYAGFTAGLALFPYMYFGQPSGRELGRAFLGVIIVAMATYWIITYRNWLRDKAEDPDTPHLAGAFIWHMLVLAAIAWQFL